jgi:hypothetical protein
MNCTVTALKDLPEADRRFIASALTHPGSDFQNKLAQGQLDGSIAVVRDVGDIVGWTRTEHWERWHTLESFVCISHRGRGIATFAAVGLLAAQSLPGRLVAVFHPSMLVVAKNVGLMARMFQRQGDGEWRMV